MNFNKSIQKEIAILGICSGLGQKKLGVEKGPQFLRENLIEALFTDRGISTKDFGDVHPTSDSSDEIWNVLRTVRDKSIKALSEDRLLFSMGGDHSVSIATVQATLIAYPKARVIWVDAHGDINTPATSTTGNLHGMPLAALLGLFATPLGGPILTPERLLIIGARDLDPAEKVIVDQLKISLIQANEILTAPELALKKINGWISQDLSNPIHLSFDLDAVDPHLAPATGIHVPFGLTEEFCVNMIELIATTKLIVSIDVVEINPLMASPEELKKTAQVLKNILAEVCFSCVNRSINLSIMQPIVAP